MLRLLGVLVLLAAVVIGLGYYLGWFRITADRTDQNTNITIQVDQEQMEEDRKKVQEKLEEVGRKAKEKVSPP
jgi:predicted negative regulator of RcsB-dependent stress response